MKKAKTDLILAAVVLLVAAVGFLINYQLHKVPASRVEVSIDGKIAEIYDLNRDTDVVIQGYGNGTNHLLIQDKTVWISEATCSDHICVHQGKISKNGEMIICLPNRVIVQVVTE